MTRDLTTDCARQIDLASSAVTCDVTVTVTATALPVPSGARSPPLRCSSAPPFSPKISFYPAATNLKRNHFITRLSSSRLFLTGEDIADIVDKSSRLSLSTLHQGFEVHSLAYQRLLEKSPLKPLFFTTIRASGFRSLDLVAASRPNNPSFGPSSPAGSGLSF